MKRAILIVCGLAIFTVTKLCVIAQEDPVITQAQIEKHLLGEWLGISGHWGKENPPPSTRHFTFRENHEVEVVVGKDKFVGNYKIDITKEPFDIDFTFEVNGKKVTTLTIFDFPSEGHLRIAEWDPTWRRKEFNPGIIFKKKEPSNSVSEAMSPKRAAPDE